MKEVIFKIIIWILFVGAGYSFWLAGICISLQDKMTGMDSILRIMAGKRFLVTIFLLILATILLIQL